MDIRETGGHMGTLDIWDTIYKGEGALKIMENLGTLYIRDTGRHLTFGILRKSEH